HPSRCRRSRLQAARRKFAAPQRVILKKRPPLPRMKDPKRRSPLCSPLPVYPQPATHPPIGVLLKTKGKVQFERTVDRLSKPFFCRFCQSNRCHFAGHFTLVTLCRRTI